MDPLKREAIRLQTVALIDNMNPNLLGPYLYSRQLLTADEFERLQLPSQTTRDRNTRIVQIIPRKGVNAFQSFLECLEESGRRGGEPAHVELVDKLRQQLEQLLPS